MAPTTEYPAADTTIDWSVITPLVEEKARQAAAHCAEQYGKQTLLDRDDLFQEALILCAGNAERVRGYLSAGEVNHLYVWLRGKIQDKARTEYQRASRSISYEVAVEAWSE
ncbi:hypothetical protein [Actinoplanes sp. NPDC026670]|uniref:hypothetical protein n=1 Tax=Actinoplanes sp. NPDC026670 TaxID=3154700 RepID=UPI0033D5FF43